MKIAVISNLFSPYERGGAEKIVKKTISQFVNNKHSVTLITSKPFKNIKSLIPKEDKINNNLKIFRFYPLNILYYLNDYKHASFVRLIFHVIDVFNIHAFFTVLFLLFRDRPNLLFVHNLKGIGYLNIIAAKLLRIRVVYTLHDVQLLTPTGLFIKDEEEDWQHNNFFTKCYKFINKYLFSFVDEVIAPSNYILEVHQKNGFFKNTKNHIIVNPVTIPPVVRYIKEGKWTELNFLYLGQIEKHKGIEFLLKAWLDYLNMNDYLKYTLHVIGDGALLNDLKNKYNENKSIEFYGKIDHDNLKEVFPKMDFTIFPSLCYENCPGVILESFSYDVPVISSDLGGAKELVCDGFNGLVFQANNDLSFHTVLDDVKMLLLSIDDMKKMPITRQKIFN